MILKNVKIKKNAGVVWALVVDTDTTLFSIFGLILDLLAQIVHPEANE